MKTAVSYWQNENESIRGAGLWKTEGVIATAQQAQIVCDDGVERINMCANNYLGLAGSAEARIWAKEALDEWGYGLSSVRFICGTQKPHKELEAKIASFVGMPDAILYSSCFDANGGLFETLTTGEDAIISDELNHASIIDGVRLSKAMRYRYKNNDMADLERALKEASGARIRLIVTDGVFSMDGIIANLKGVCDLAERYDAIVVVDDSHATGVIGATGRGSHEYNGVMGRVDIITGTFGKALGGASGGFTAASREIVDLLRQRSRPYLFSNTLMPAITVTTIEILETLKRNLSYKQRMDGNAAYLRKGLQAQGLDVPDGAHPIIPVMFGDERIAQRFARRLWEKGVYAVGFVFPVVPKGRARIRTQASAAHTKELLDRVIEAFAEVKAELGGTK